MALRTRVVRDDDVEVELVLGGGGSGSRGGRTRTVTFKVDERLVWLLDRVAEEKGMNRSDAIRQAIVEWLRRNGVRV